MIYDYIIDIFKKTFIILKTSIQKITFIVASSAVTVIHCCTWFENSQLWGTFRGRGDYRILKHLYLNDYAGFDSKIYYIMFYMIIFWPVKYLRYGPPL